ncbi:hypothetical protein ScalyP_jg10053 [Parmales sp. scaly parma]|nr:hypothetical protein ScalyP_jg10053 [Parmales sp. scaly parma]
MGVCGQIIKDLPNSSSSSLPRLPHLPPELLKLVQPPSQRVNRVPWGLAEARKYASSPVHGTMATGSTPSRPLHEAPSLVETSLSERIWAPRRQFPQSSSRSDGKLAESYHNLALLAFTTDASEGANGSHFNTLAITASLSEMAGTPPGSLDSEDAKILRLSCRSFANFASSCDVSMANLPVDAIAQNVLYRAARFRAYAPNRRGNGKA